MIYKINEKSKKMLEEAFQKQPRQFPRRVAKIAYEALSFESEIDRSKEHLWVMGLSLSYRLEYFELTTLGTLKRTVSDNITLFRLAIAKGSAIIIIIHNHPSRYLIPSAADIKLTKHIINGSKNLDIQVLDHIIIGKNIKDKFFSMALENTVKFRR